MVLPLIAGGVAAIGSFFGGRKRSKAAGRAEARAVSDRQDALRIAMQDQDRALKLREGDEARLKTASGYDLAKLVADARSAGFNPLTVLQNTGGAGYDGRGAVLTSPFISQAEVYLGGSGAVGAARGQVVETAGYLGDAISAGGSAYFNQLNQERAFQQAQQQIDLQGAELRMMFPGGARVAAVASVSPKTNVDQSLFIGPRRPVSVRLPAGGWGSVDAQIADQLGLKAGDFWFAENNEAILGDSVSEIVNIPNMPTGKTPVLPYGNAPGVFGPPLGETPTAVEQSFGTTSYNYRVFDPWSRDGYRVYNR